MTTISSEETATLAGGCFWCLEAVFNRLRGVIKVESGYMGGSVNSPTYRQVCTGQTGHAEVVQISFDPNEISFAQILEVFFSTHDPTTLNRQGNDIGTQYRSAIFYHSPRQKEIAESFIAKLSNDRIWKDPIVTEVATAQTFYPAEGYHQQYFEHHGFEPYCQLVVKPKVEKAQLKFSQLLK